MELWIPRILQAATVASFVAAIFPDLVPVWRGQITGDIGRRILLLLTGLGSAGVVVVREKTAIIQVGQAVRTRLATFAAVVILAGSFATLALDPLPSKHVEVVPTPGSNAAVLATEATEQEPKGDAALPTMTASPTPVASSASATPVGVPAIARPTRAFALEDLTIANICHPPWRQRYQCGVLDSNVGIAGLLETYIQDSGDATRIDCNRRSYDELVAQTQSLNGIEAGAIVQRGDVLALPLLPCHGPDEVDRSAKDVSAAAQFLTGLTDLLEAYPSEWAQPSVDELEPIAEAPVQDALLNVFHYFNDRYEGQPVTIQVSSSAHWIDGDYYLIALTVDERVTLESGACFGARHRWFALAEISQAGRLFAIGDAVFTPAFAIANVCG